MASGVISSVMAHIFRPYRSFGAIVHLRSETVAIHRRMNIVLDDYDDKRYPGSRCPDICLTFDENSWKNLNQKVVQPGVGAEIHSFPALLIRTLWLIELLLCLQYVQEEDYLI